jgi:DNA primase
VLDNDAILTLIGPHRKASRNNIMCDCPFCGKAMHFYIQLKTDKVDKYGVNKSFNFDCKRCGEQGRVFKLLAQLGATHLIEGELVDINKKLDEALLETFAEESEEPLSLDIEDMKMPIGFERIYDDPYLRSRGFTDFEFQKYVIGYDRISFKLEDYIMIAQTRDGDNKAYLARTTKTGKEIAEIDAVYKKKGLKKTYPRYRNSLSVFTRLLGGYDEITFLTSTVILVEGYFDKVKTDQIMELDFQQDVKCCYTYGKKISIEQIMLLLKKGVENIILVYDPDAVNDMKKIGFVLKKHFETVLVGFPKDKDLGDSSQEEFDEIFSNLQTAFEFSLNKVQIIQL